MLERWRIRDDEDLMAIHDAKVAAEREAGPEADHIKIRSRWLLRYMNDDVLAIADFFAIRYTDFASGSTRSRIEPPSEFKYMLRDDRNDVIVMDYWFERISDFDYGNYRALGFPRAVYSQEHGLLVLELPNDDIPRPISGD